MGVSRTKKEAASPQPHRPITHGEQDHGTWAHLSVSLAAKRAALPPAPAVGPRRPARAGCSPCAINNVGQHWQRLAAVLSSNTPMMLPYVGVPWSPLLEIPTGTRLAMHSTSSRFVAWPTSLTWQHTQLRRGLARSQSKALSPRLTTLAASAALRARPVRADR